MYLNPPAGAIPPSPSLILAEQPVARMSLSLPILRAGAAVVFSKADGSVVDLRRQLTWMEALSGRYKTMYEVDVARQRCWMVTDRDDLPTRDDRFYFVGDVCMEWQVTEPDKVVKEQVRDGRPYVMQRIMKLMRDVSRQYEITECERAEREINQLVDSPIRIRDYGLTVRHISARVSLDQAARIYLQEQTGIDRDKDLQERGHGRDLLALTHEHGLEAERRRAVMNGVQGEFGLIVQHLRHHPGEAMQVLQLMHQRQQELEQRRQASFASSTEMFAKLVDEGHIQAADIQDIVKQVLNNTLNVVAGTPDPPHAVLGGAGALPANQGSQPGQSAQAAPAAASIRPTPGQASRPRQSAQPAAPAAPSNGVGGWRGRKPHQTGTGTS
jgi:hypothetical protein